jgi:anion-transporting  ArsA/GET3 family ATPase
VIGAGTGVFVGLFSRIMGAQVLGDVSTFVAALETMFGGFRQRAEQTYALLKAPGTAFLVVAAPEPDALREATYFVERLSQERMPLAGLVLNRVHRTAVPDLTAQRSRAAADALADRDEAPLAAAVLRVHAERAALALREQRLSDRFRAAHPAVPVVEVGALAGDVHDLESLRQVGGDLGAGGAGRSGAGAMAGAPASGAAVPA